MTPVSALNHSPQPPAKATGPGKSAASVGHLAKQAVAAAREAGVELPRNAQGVAASQIARGADPSSVFAAQIAALTPAEADTATSPVAAADDTVQDDSAPADAIAAYQFNAPAITTTTLEPAQTALSLLRSE